MRTMLMNRLAATFLLALAGCGSSNDSGSSDGGGDPTSSSTTSGSGGASSSTSSGSTSSSASSASSAGGGGSGGAPSTGDGGNNAGGGGGAPGEEARIPWDWAGIVGTGQSLSVGTTPVTSTTQPFHNLKLSLGNTRVPPWDPNSSALSMVPLVEPIRPLANGYPAPYPGNIYGETGHVPMANQITFLVNEAAGRDYVSVHTVVGESGQGMVALKKGATDTGTTGRAYAATLFEVGAIARLAQAAGKTYGVGAVFLTHGETDSGSSTYGDEVVRLWSDYNADLKALTGQTETIPLFISQQHGYPSGANQRAVSTLTQWRLGVEHPGDIVCTGPKYHLPGGGDGVHLSAAGYQQMGEKYGQIYYEKVVMGRDWQPLQPTRVERSGRVITVHFHVPVPPLVWDERLPAPTAWANGRGFEVRQGNTKINISSVEIAGDSVKITCAGDLPASGVTVGYAMTTNQAPRPNGFPTWGQLRDSDPFVGSTTRVAQPNYSVSFEMPVP
ncbi:dockerin [Sorangium cellulosum]|uniref:Dockerin n=1 Tax=Sorangium cellulosum TaxID=56 RepID=A0A2L0EYJ0_SORCE|nr:dockerin [Sorangium cellulosum]AUX44362.1 dockerin [Sorangium cellulosum]